MSPTTCLTQHVCETSNITCLPQHVFNRTTPTARLSQHVSQHVSHSIFPTKCLGKLLLRGALSHKGANSYRRCSDWFSESCRNWIKFHDITKFTLTLSEVQDLSLVSMLFPTDVHWNVQKHVIDWKPLMSKMLRLCKMTYSWLST